MLRKTEKKALNFLFQAESYPGLVRRKESEVKLILWRNPTLGDYTSWTLFDTQEGYYLRQISWKHCLGHRLNEPQIYGREVLLCEKTINAINKKLKDFKFDADNLILEEDGLAIDGVYAGIVYQNKKLKWVEKENSPFFKLSELFHDVLLILSQEVTFVRATENDDY